MEVENDPEFWDWLIEQQKHQNKQKESFQPLVLELPLPPPNWKRPEVDEPTESPSREIDIYGDDCIIFEL